MIVNKLIHGESEYYIILRDSGVYSEKYILSIFVKFKVW